MFFNTFKLQKERISCLKYWQQKASYIILRCKSNTRDWLSHETEPQMLFLKVKMLGRLHMNGYESVSVTEK